MSKRVWENLPSAYRIGSDPSEPVTFWRGDWIGKELTGMTAQLGSASAEQAVYDSLFVKYPNLRTLVKRHCQNNFGSPFISLTSDLSIATFFAQTPKETVYEITVPASRLVADPPRGNENQPVELLAIGSIKPHEISAVLRVNDKDSTAKQWDRSISWTT